MHDSLSRKIGFNCMEEGSVVVRRLVPLSRPISLPTLALWSQGRRPSLTLLPLCWRSLIRSPPLTDSGTPQPLSATLQAPHSTPLSPSPLNTLPHNPSAYLRSHHTVLLCFSISLDHSSTTRIFYTRVYTITPSQTLSSGDITSQYLNLQSHQTILPWHHTSPFHTPSTLSVFSP